jgi:hypothetical protein
LNGARLAAEIRAAVMAQFAPAAEEGAHIRKTQDDALEDSLPLQAKHFRAMAARAETGIQVPCSHRYPSEYGVGEPLFYHKKREK